MHPHDPCLQRRARQSRMMGIPWFALRWSIFAGRREPLFEFAGASVASYVPRMLPGVRRYPALVEERPAG